MSTIEALRELEDACENLAATRPQKAYDAMIDGGQEDALLRLDRARQAARAALATPTPSGKPWMCACGWRGDIMKAPANPSGGRVCPSCGGSGGLASAPELDGGIKILHGMLAEIQAQTPENWSKNRKLVERHLREQQALIDQLAREKKELVQALEPLPLTDKRMSAYYYGFSTTGDELIDRILSAVACAGKAYHHTDNWTDDCELYEDVHRGQTCIDWMQNAANDAAEYLRRARRLAVPNPEPSLKKAEPFHSVNRTLEERARFIADTKGRLTPAPMPSDAEIDAALAQIRRSKGHGQKET